MSNKTALCRNRSNLNFDKCVASLCKISGKNSMY